MEAALERAERDGTMFVDAVLRLGLLSEAALFRAERERVKTVVIESFAWAQGQYSFANSDDFITEVGIYEVNPLRCLAAAVRRFLTINELAADLERHSEQNFIEGARFQRLFPYIELPESLSGLVDCMDRGIRVSQLFGRFAANNELLIKYLWLMFNLGIADSLPSLDNGAASDD